MDKENTVQQKLETYAKNQPWAQYLLEFFSFFEPHSGSLTFLFTIATAILTFSFKWLYHKGLEGYFAYYRLPVLKLETSFEEIISTVLFSLFVAAAFLFSLWLFCAVSKKTPQIGLKLLNLLLLSNAYAFLFITVALFSMSLRYPVIIFLGVLGFYLLCFIVLELALVGIRDILGSYWYQTNQKMRMWISLFCSVVLFMVLRYLLKDILFNVVFLYALVNGGFLVIFGWFSLLLHFSKPEKEIQRFLDRRNPQRRESWRHTLLAGCGLFLAVLCFFCIWLLTVSLRGIGNTVASQRRTYTIIAQYQNTDWAVVYETSEKFYLAPVGIDSDSKHLQFFPAPGRIVSKEDLPLAQQTFDAVSPPEAS